MNITVVVEMMARCVGNYIYTYHHTILNFFQNFSAELSKIGHRYYAQTFVFVFRRAGAFKFLANLVHTVVAFIYITARNTRRLPKMALAFGLRLQT